MYTILAQFTISECFNFEASEDQTIYIFVIYLNSKHILQTQIKPYLIET